MSSGLSQDFTHVAARGVLVKRTLSALMLFIPTRLVSFLHQPAIEVIRWLAAGSNFFKVLRRLSGVQ